MRSMKQIAIMAFILVKVSLRRPLFFSGAAIKNEARYDKGEDWLLKGHFIASVEELLGRISIDRFRVEKRPDGSVVLVGTQRPWIEAKSVGIQKSIASGVLDPVLRVLASNRPSFDENGKLVFPKGATFKLMDGQHSWVALLAELERGVNHNVTVMWVYGASTQEQEGELFTSPNMGSKPSSHLLAGLDYDEKNRTLERIEAAGLIPDAELQKVEIPSRLVFGHLLGEQGITVSSMKEAQAAAKRQGWAFISPNVQADLLGNGARRLFERERDLHEEETSLGTAIGMQNGVYLLYYVLDRIDSLGLMDLLSIEGWYEIIDNVELRGENVAKVLRGHGLEDADGIFHSDVAKKLGTANGSTLSMPWNHDLLRATVPDELIISVLTEKRSVAA